MHWWSGLLTAQVLSNSFFRSKMPSMDDVLRNNPMLAKQMAAAAAQQAGPGFGNFMGMAMGVPPQHAAMVGDQLFTDIKAGSRAGVKTILVNPLTSRDFIGTKLVSRTLENLVLRGAHSRP